MSLCYLGANVNVKDQCGCNFLHLAILQPKGLKNLPEEVLQVPSMFLYDLSNALYSTLLRQRCHHDWNLITSLSLMDLL